MSGLIARVRNSRPRVPVEIADAVEKWARRWGRHAKVVFITHTDPPIPQVRISPKDDDPIRESVQNGRIEPEAAEETVELMYWDDDRGTYVPYDLQELGVQGVLRILNRGNTWSGSGEFDSLDDAFEEAEKTHEREAKKSYEDGREDARAVGRAVKHHMLDIPKHRAGIEFEDDEASPEAPPTEEGD